MKKKSKIDQIDVIKTLTELMKEFPRRGTSKKYSLFLIICSYYKKNDDLFAIKAIPGEELTLKIYPFKSSESKLVAKHISAKKKNFSSLKSSLNKTLTTMMLDGQNPSRILIGKTNTITLSPEREQLKSTKVITNEFEEELQTLLKNSGVTLDKKIEKKLSKLTTKVFTAHKKNIYEVSERQTLFKAKKTITKQATENEELKSQVIDLQNQICKIEQKVQPEADTETLDSPPETSTTDADLIDKLTSIVRETIKEDFSAISEDDLKHKEQEKSLSDQELKVIELMQEIADKDSVFRKESLRIQEESEKRFSEERDKLFKKIEELTTERSTFIEEKNRLIKERFDLQTELDNDVEKLARKRSGIEKLQNAERAKNYKQGLSLLEEEIKFKKERDFARRGFVAKEENIQKMATDNMIAGMGLNEDRTALEKEKEVFRKELQDKYDGKIEDLRKKYDKELSTLNSEKLKHLQERAELEQEKQLHKKNQDDYQKKIDTAIKQRFSKKVDELKQREDALKKRVKKLDDEEKLLLTDKKKIADEMSAGLTGKSSLKKLKQLIEKQENLLKHKFQFIQSESQIHKNLVEDLKKRSEEHDNEAEAKKSELKEEEERLAHLNTSLIDKEKQLTNDIAKTHSQLQDNYEKTIKQKNEDFEEKEEEFRQKQDEVAQRENELLEKQKQQIDVEKEALEKSKDKEKELAEYIEKNIKTKEQLLQKEQALIQREERIEKDYATKHESLHKDFHKKLQKVKKDHSMLSYHEERLAEKEALFTNDTQKNQLKREEELTRLGEELKLKEAQFTESFSELELQKKELIKLKKEVEQAIKGRTEAFEEKISKIDQALGNRIEHYVDKLGSELSNRSKDGHTNNKDQDSKTDTTLNGKDNEKLVAGIEKENAVENDGENKSDVKLTESKDASGIPLNIDKSDANTDDEKNNITKDNEGEQSGFNQKESEDGSGVPLIFEGGNIYSGSTGGQLVSKAVKFDGNLEELATTPAFLKALAHKYSTTLLIEPGQFELGCNTSFDSSPRHQVTIEKPFILSKYPVTNLQFLRFTKETGYLTSIERKLTVALVVGGGRKAIRDNKDKVIGYSGKNISYAEDRGADCRHPYGKNSSVADKYHHPVTQVTWEDAMAYCKWLTETTGTPYRLPTEMEWEYAASSRGELKTSEFYWIAEEDTSLNCNCVESMFSDTTPVDYFKQNSSIDGICDLLGNIWEWTSSPFEPYEKRSSAQASDPDYKTTRGGGFTDHKEKISFWARRGYRSLHATSFIGFRIVSDEVK